MSYNRYIMKEATTIQLNKSVVKDLKNIKKYPRETYNETISGLIKLAKESKNVVIAGITSNLKMKGISLTKSEGAIKESVIKLNYIFTISQEMVSKVIFHLSNEKKALLFEKLTQKLGGLKK